MVTFFIKITFPEIIEIVAFFMVLNMLYVKYINYWRWWGGVGNCFLKLEFSMHTYLLFFFQKNLVKLQRTCQK